MTITDLVVYGLVLMIGTIALFLVLNRYAPKLMGNQFPERAAREERERLLAEDVAELTRKYKYLDEDTTRRIKDLELQVSVLSNALGDAHNRIGEQNGKIATMQREMAAMENELNALRKGELKQVVPTVATVRVLGVWPTAPQLDLVGDKEALFASGFEYEALEGENATRMGIVLELDRKHYTHMEIGAQGGAGGIKLSDGITPPGWWLQLARQHSIQTFIVLANLSSTPGTLNVADALYNAGAQAVISVDNTINDADAVKFARVLYGRLSQNVPLKKAFEFAKLVISDAGSESVRLRER